MLKGTPPANPHMLPQSSRCFLGARQTLVSRPLIQSNIPRIASLEVHISLPPMMDAQWWRPWYADPAGSCAGGPIFDAGKISDIWRWRATVPRWENGLVADRQRRQPPLTNGAAGILVDEARRVLRLSLPTRPHRE